MLPNLIIAGTQKAGTTWLHVRLAEHPDIFMSGKKELKFFSKAPEERDRAAYEAEFAGAGDVPWRGEATPGYFWSAEEERPRKRGRGGWSVPRDMAGMLGQDIRVIITLRHPVRRAVSAYLHHMRKGRADTATGLREIMERFGITDIGRYERHVDVWRDVFPDDRLRFWRFDELSANGQGTLSEIFGWLGVSDMKVPGAQTAHHIGFGLAREGDAMVVDTGDRRTMNVAKRRGVSDVDAVRIEQADLDALSEALAPHIAFVNREVFPDLPPWKERLTLDDIA